MHSSHHRQGEKISTSQFCLCMCVVENVLRLALHSKLQPLFSIQVRRTVKFLCGVAKGVHIVYPKWIYACKAAGTFVGE